MVLEWWKIEEAVKWGKNPNNNEKQSKNTPKINTNITIIMTMMIITITVMLLLLIIINENKTKQKVLKSWITTAFLHLQHLVKSRSVPSAGIQDRRVSVKASHTHVL